MTTAKASALGNDDPQPGAPVWSRLENKLISSHLLDTFSIPDSYKVKPLIEGDITLVGKSAVFIPPADSPNETPVLCVGSFLNIC